MLVGSETQKTSGKGPRSQGLSQLQSCDIGLFPVKKAKVVGVLHIETALSIPCGTGTEIEL